MCYVGETEAIGVGGDRGAPGAAHHLLSVAAPGGGALNGLSVSPVSARAQRAL